MNVGEMQRKLSLWAEQDREHKFHDLYHLLYDQDWLRLAHDYVAHNAGSLTAGCDGINMKLFDEALEENLQRLAQELKSDTFEPYPVRRVHIPKANGKFRALGIPSIRDRIVQQALRMVLEPIYEADFSQYSFGFRPNRCTMDAVAYAASNTMARRTYYWIIEGDISSYFDTINHRILMKLLQRRIKDKKILRLIWKFLRAGVMEGKLFTDTKLGTPQGGIVSPLLANIYLDELDKYLERCIQLSCKQRVKRRQSGEANYIPIRYADDFVILCNGTRAQAETLKEELHSFLRTELRLELAKEKTKITHVNDGFNFLGFQVKRAPGGGHGDRRTRILIPEEAVDKLLRKIRHTTSPQTHQDSISLKILSLNRIIEGWCRYYQYTSKAKTQFYKIETYAFWRMAHWLGRKFHLKMPEVMKRYYKDGTFVIGEHRLRRVGAMKTSIYRKQIKKPNPYTMQVSVYRETLLQETYWTGCEARPGMADLREVVLQRDNYLCQMCDGRVTSRTAEIDHVRPVRRFKRPVDANSLTNLWTLCIKCHKAKTRQDRQMESRMH